MIRRCLLAVSLVGAMVVVAAPAGAQQYPPAANFIALSDTTLVPGQTFTITAGVFLPGSTVTFTFLSDPVNLGSAIANAVGTASASATVPVDAPLGAHTVTASGQSADGPLTLSASVTVVPAAGAGGAGAGAGAGNLPRTGDDTSIPLTRVAAVLLAGGGVLVFTARRRRHAKAKVAEPV
jgi:LPXTG-motif cell wall-anchored protein